MIRYDWKVLRKYPVKNIMQVIGIYTKKLQMYQCNKRTIEAISKIKSRNAFLKHPEALWHYKYMLTDSEIYVYLELAALRSYIKYIETGNLRLPTSYIEGYNIDKLKFNKALLVTTKEIIFRFEEM